MPFSFSNKRLIITHGTFLSKKNTQCTKYVPGCRGHGADVGGNTPRTLSGMAAGPKKKLHQKMQGFSTPIGPNCRQNAHRWVPGEWAPAWFQAKIPLRDPKGCPLGQEKKVSKRAAFYCPIIGHPCSENTPLARLSGPENGCRGGSRGKYRGLRPQTFDPKISPG